MLFNSFTLSFCFVRCVHFVAFVVFILFVLLISFPAFLSAYLPNILTIFRHSASCEQKEKNKRLRSSRAKTIDSEADSFFDICRQSSVTSLENCKQTCLDRQVIFFLIFHSFRLHCIIHSYFINRTPSSGQMSYTNNNKHSSIPQHQTLKEQREKGFLFKLSLKIMNAVLKEKEKVNEKHKQR